MADTSNRSALYSFSCPRCDSLMEPVFFMEEEEKTSEEGWWKYKTGRVRRAVSHLECPHCFNKECVDDSFDGPWRQK